MKKTVLLFLVVLTLGLNAQDVKDVFKGWKEVYFSFHSTNEVPLNKVSRIVSIDNVKDGQVFAYANEKEFVKFLSLGIDYEMLPHPSESITPEMRSQVNIKEINSWDFYPTYDGYVDLMHQFVTDHPGMCELVSIDTLTSGREILFIHINNDLTTPQNKPKLLYTSTMHGDELTGYVMMLHFIDYLLNNYGTDPKITDIVNNVDIWINPLANPDGTYHNGNNTVYGATRFNANYVDLNRNYPDPDEGPHPDGNVYQSETQAFMKLADDHHFVMAANFHGGAEVVNYPWDTWYKRAADDNWWQYVSREYADTAHVNSPPGYMTDLQNGITNGFDWYEVAGGRQDYMNYFQHCREVTIELSTNKTPPESQLESFFDYNYRSLLNYMEQSTFGLRGTVTNTRNNHPMEAEIFIDGHDKDQSQVYSSLPVGNYHRLIKAGNYDVTFSAYGFQSRTETVSIQDGQATVLDVQLTPLDVVYAGFYASDTIISTGKTVDFFDISYGDSIVAWQWDFPGGTPDHSTQQNPTGISYGQNGGFDVTLTVTDSSGATSTLTKTKYIQVVDSILMQNGTFTTCYSMFYDHGGSVNNYDNDEDYVLTIYPAANTAMLKVEFLMFDVENEISCNYDYLEIYDGSNTNAGLIGRYCGSAGPGTVTASNDNGALTFKFHSDPYTTKQGWKALVGCDTGVGIVQHSLPSLQLYPNPVTDRLRVVSEKEIKKLVITDLQGREFLLTVQMRYNSAVINTSSLAEGVYIVKMVGAGNTAIGKFVKQ